MTRADKFTRLQETSKQGLDLLIIGGGATGLGLAVDGATRGYRTALVEAGDFAQATSSRATKLVHGGVRYLASGQIHLVYEALRERRILLENARHLVQPLPFLTPAYRWFDLPYYGAGLKAYEVLSGKASLGRTRILSVRETRERIPGIEPLGLKGSLLYYDGQFDDARLALALARTADDYGATVLNYARCTAIQKQNGLLSGVTVEDVETGSTLDVSARCVINATGIFVDKVRALDKGDRRPMLSVSRGTHVVVHETFLGGQSAIMVPRTRDGRIIFAIPWLGRVVIGTTDLPDPRIAIEPGHAASEIEFLLETINPYLVRPISRGDILSVFSGLRPLVTGSQSRTSKLSREHAIEVAPSGLITIAGGKWTTYRRMAEDTIDTAIRHHMLPARACVTRTVRVHGAPEETPAPGPLSCYGTEEGEIRDMCAGEPQLAEALDAALPFTRAQVVFAVRHEMARTVEDVLSRRMRALLLDARAAQRAAPVVGRMVAEELGRGAGWATQQSLQFQQLAAAFYMPAGDACAGTGG